LQHAEILSALQARDPKMAHAAAVLHIGTSQAWFRQNVYAERRIPAGMSRSTRGRDAADEFG
jgi:hypothetical protein